MDVGRAWAGNGPDGWAENRGDVRAVSRAAVSAGQVPDTARRPWVSGHGTKKSGLGRQRAQDGRDTVSGSAVSGIPRAKTMSATAAAAPKVRKAALYPK